MLLSWIVVGTGLLVRTVVAHGWVGHITIAGTVYQGNGLGTTGGPSVIRQVDTNSPVTSVSDPNLSCGPHAQPASQIANANPGDAIAVDWVSTEGPWFHDVGPLLTYLANCGSQTCDQFDASQAQWFKIEEAGRDASGWAQAQLNSGAPATLNLPSNLAAGNYLLRHEIIALQNGGSQGGAEFYASCSQLKVGGSGTGAPTSSELVKFPGAYSATDPGILVDVYTNTGAPYSFPGPPIAAFAGGSPSPPATPTTQPGLTPFPRYRTLVKQGTLRGDDHQTRIIQKLQDLHDKLVGYDPPRVSPSPASSSGSSLFSRLLGRTSSPEPAAPPADAPKGLYLYGDVGTGKTMLMDLFYSTLPPEITRKRRVHFHAFMIDVHKRIHAVKARKGSSGDPILPVARDLANEASVLCFDEFQVTDIADAMILRRLLESLLNFGVVCVITSNRHPDDLYKNGIQRSSFIPAIELLKSQFEVTDLDSGTDYRRMARVPSSVKPYHHPLSPETAQTMASIFDSLHSEEDPVVRDRKLTIWGRTLLVPESTSTVAKFTFQQLCENPLSAADYIEITRVFGTIFLLDVWKIGVDRKDLARRFITFIDACYESKTRLFISSEVPIYQVFSGDAKSGEVTAEMRETMEELGLTADLLKSSMFTGEEEIFAFARACSRLVQMESKEWAESAGTSAVGIKST
ncbi:unnamed protein product [Mycena citricolor]|uniref:AA9 family lytic polysaccharide monooxygenase n=1 Tax=Mycena citricolor TaxID=2018698 RepID=A0AAD2GS39_9AGAR|nr:unnamed protein product [Mycena citricolor]CAK5262566.1 unnamed protein product [Mycena citricolor]